MLSLAVEAADKVGQLNTVFDRGFQVDTGDMVLYCFYGNKKLPADILIAHTSDD